MTRYEKYQEARKAYLKNKEREANNYHRQACRATAKSSEWNKKQNQNAD